MCKNISKMSINKMETIKIIFNWKNKDLVGYKNKL
jgi:hypothetical protein